VAGDWRRLHNEELHNLYASPNIIRVINARNMRGTVRVARMGEVRCAESILVEDLKGRDHLEDLSVEGRIILQWTLEKQGRKMWTGCIWLRIWTSGGLL
jgi:hypothetical protein